MKTVSPSKVTPVEGALLARVGLIDDLLSKRNDGGVAAYLGNDEVLLSKLGNFVSAHRRLVGDAVGRNAEDCVRIFMTERHQCRDDRSGIADRLIQNEVGDDARLGVVDGARVLRVARLRTRGHARDAGLRAWLQRD